MLVCAVELSHILLSDSMVKSGEVLMYFVRKEDRVCLLLVDCVVEMMVVEYCVVIHIWVLDM